MCPGGARAHAATQAFFPLTFFPLTLLPAHPSSRSPFFPPTQAFFPLQFIGRQAEWQQLVAAAVGQEKRILTLIGPKGMGKTSLALAASHYLYERSTFSGGVLFVQVSRRSGTPDASFLTHVSMPCMGVSRGARGGSWRPWRGVVLSVPALARARCAPQGPRHPPAPRGGPRVIMSARAPAVVRPSHSQAEGAANAVELSALILAALAEARAGADEDSGAHTPPGLEREETDSFVGGGGAGGPLPSTLRRLGRCLLLIDHIELPQGGAGTAGMMALLQNLLQVRTSLGSALPPGAPRTRTALLAAGRTEVLSVTARAPLQLFGSRSARC